MYSVTIQMYCFEKCSEMLPEDGINGENLLRELIEHILLELFLAVTFDQVSVRALPVTEEQGQRFSVYIVARCMNRTDPIVQQDLTYMELVLEGRISCTLLELVGMIDMEDVSIVDHSVQEERILSYHS